MSKYYIEIPEVLNQKYELENDKAMLLKVVSDGMLVNVDRDKRLQLPVRSLIFVGILSLFVFIGVFFKYNQIPLTGQLSTATLVIVLGGLTGMFNFTLYFIRNKKSDEKRMSQSIYWRNFPTVFLSYSVLMVLGLLMLFRILGQLFVGASFDIYTSSVIGTLFVMIVNFLMIHVAQSLTPELLIKSLIAIILGGVTIAMITNKDQQWWLHNLSFLGTPEASNAWQFNLTLMLSALLMVALIDYLFVLLYDQLGRSKRLVCFKYLLIATAVCLGGVGFFPYNDSPFNQQMHNRSAGFLVYLFIILIAALKWLMPSISKGFLKFSYLVAAGLVVAVVLFQGVNYLSLTAFELIAFVLAFTWLLLLLRILVNIVMNVGEVFVVQLKEIKVEEIDIVKADKI